MISLVMVVIALKLAATIFNPVDFGLYNVVRRYIAILNYPLLLGLGISIPVYVAKYYKSQLEQGIYITVSFFLWVAVTIFFSILNLVLPGKITFLVLGLGYEHFMWPILVGFSSLYLYTILYATYRGEQNFSRANIFQIVSAGIVPVSALLFSRGNVANYFRWFAFLMFIINGFVLLDLYKRKLLIFINFTDFKNALRLIFRFGLPRVPGEFALFGLMSFPLFFIARYDSLDAAGYIAIGFTLVQLVASLFEFLGIMLLPKSAHMIADNQYFELKHLVNKLTIISFFTSLVISFFIYMNLEFILNLIGKGKFLDHLEYARMIIFCIPFYIVYLILRNPQDALSIKPYNTYNLSICFILQVLLLVISNYTAYKIFFYYTAIIFPFSLLGVVTFITWNHQIKKRIG